MYLVAKQAQAEAKSLPVFLITVSVHPLLFPNCHALHRSSFPRGKAGTVVTSQLVLPS